MVMAHVTKLRQNEFLSNARYVVVIEANQQVAATDLAEALEKSRFPNLIFLKESKGVSRERNQPGFITTAQSKEKMILIIKDYLRHKKICFTEDFVRALPSDIGIADLKTEFERQMRKFSKKRMVTRDHRNDIDVVHYTYSGKVIKENDDFPMATMFAGYGRELFFRPDNRAKYGHYW